MIQYRLLAGMLGTIALYGQGLDPRALTLFHQPPDVWPTYNGDYSGRRFSQLDQINQSNLDLLKIDWIYRITGVGPQRGVGNPEIKSTPLMVNGILYFTIPDHVFAIDARTGARIWQFDFEDHGGHLTGQRGVGMYGNWLYFLTPDGWFISLNAQDGKERWRKKVADEKLQYFTTMAPLVVKNHMLVGVGGDAMDVRGYLEARDPETGDMQWRWWTEPEKPGDPGAETWPNQGCHGSRRRHDLDARHLRSRAEPALLGHGQCEPRLRGAEPQRGESVDGFGRGAQSGYRQAGVVVPGIAARYARLGQRGNARAVRCRNRWQAAQAAGARRALRVVLRAGPHQRKGPRVETVFGTGNWAKGVDAKGQPIPDAAKEPKVDGSMIDVPIAGATNWPPPSYDPQTELFYLNGREGYGIAYLYDTSDEPEGYGGGGSATFDPRSALFALDVRTGETKWKHELRAGEGVMSGGVLTTAGRLLFTGDSGSLAAFDPASGKILWHQRLTSGVSNGPSTWMLDGKQYLIVGAGDTMYALKLAGK